MDIVLNARKKIRVLSIRWHLYDVPVKQGKPTASGERNQ